MQEQTAEIGIYSLSGQLLGKKLRKDIVRSDIVTDVVVFMSNSKKQMFVTKPHGNIFPGKYAPSVMTMLRVNEKAESAAKRAIKRELNFNAFPLACGKKVYDKDGIKRLLLIFYLNTPEYLVANPTDHEEAKWMYFKDIESKAALFSDIFMIGMKELRNRALI